MTDRGHRRRAGAALRTRANVNESESGRSDDERIGAAIDWARPVEPSKATYGDSGRRQLVLFAKGQERFLMAILLLDTAGRLELPAPSTISVKASRVKGALLIHPFHKSNVVI